MPRLALGALMPVLMLSTSADADNTRAGSGNAPAPAHQNAPSPARIDTGAKCGSTAIGGGIELTLSKPHLQQNPSPFQTLGHPHFTFTPGCSGGAGACNPGDGRCPDAQPECRSPRDRGACFGFGSTCEGTSVFEGFGTEAPAVVQTIIAPAPVEADPALAALRAGRYGEAAEEFLRRHIERVREEGERVGAGGTASPDRSALRLHALALAGAGDVAGAQVMFTRAYREDPLLAMDPIDGEQVLASRAELRRILVKAVRYAHRTGNPEAWMVVGYLMQAEGRFERARAMFDRAQGAPTP